MRGAAVFLVALLLLSTGNAAAVDVPVDGRVRVDGAAALTGAVVFTSARGVLDLAAHASEGNPPREEPDALGIELAWSGAHGWMVQRERRGVVGPTVEAFPGPPISQNHTLAMGPGRLRDLTCQAICELLVFTPDQGGGTIGIEGRTDDAVGWARTPVLHAVGNATLANPWGYFRKIEVGDIQAGAGTAAGTTLQDARPFVDGRVGIMFGNVTGALEEDGRVSPFYTGVRRDHLATAPGATVTHVETRYVVLFVDDLVIERRDDAPVLLSAAEALVRLDGTFHAERATGSLSWSGRTRHIEEQSLELSGILTLELETEGLTVPLLEMRIPHPPERLRARIGGEAAEIVVGRELLHRDPRAVAAAGAVLTAAVLARILLPLLYSRIAASDVLANANRRRIHETLAGGGASVVEIVRSVGLARVVVLHHLRVLEGHGLVVRRRTGRVLRFYLAILAPPAETWRVAAALLHPQRKAIVAAIGRSPIPLTAPEIAKACGISERLANHHLARLREAGALVADGERPRRYRPAAAAREAESGPAGATAA